MLRSSGVQEIGSSRQSMKTYSTTKDVAIVRTIMNTSISVSVRHVAVCDAMVYE